MSFELINSLATFGTFLVIAATAIAALVQLRHSRSSNHIVALNELRETMESAEFRAAQISAFRELPVRLQDPAFRYPNRRAIGQDRRNAIARREGYRAGKFL